MGRVVWSKPKKRKPHQKKTTNTPKKKNNSARELGEMEECGASLKDWENLYDGI